LEIKNIKHKNIFQIKQDDDLVMRSNETNKGCFMI